jgi:Flp pilus assembly pilin Flp
LEGVGNARIIERRGLPPGCGQTPTIGDPVSVPSFLRSTDESGQTMAEYAVVLGVIVIAVVVTLGLLSTAIQNLLNNVIASL